MTISTPCASTIPHAPMSRRAMLAGAAACAVFAAPRIPAAQENAGPHALPPLPYATNALSPHIDAHTMELHHGRHHAGYVRNLNAALADHPQLAQEPLHALLTRLDEAPASLRTALRNNGGGHANHSMFWEIMGPEGGAPEGALRAAIEAEFGDVESLRLALKRAGLRQFGSGWAFVTVDGEGRLGLAARPNQDTPLMEGGRVLFGVDVWEHAYYLYYQNRRGDYLDAWWNTLNWARIAERFEAARAGTLTI